jgi:LmbE family N-acetylglucosaminyl deacetylase
LTPATDLGTVLAVWAHPDDETYLCAGLMARAVREGNRVVCVTATRGELGTDDHERYPPGAPLAAIRTRELEAALAALSVTEHHWLDYPDGGCAEVPDATAIARIRGFVEEVQPDTVLTFGPDGMTGHSDHQAVCRWSTDAVKGTSARLHYATKTPEWLSVYRPPMDELGVFMGAEPPCTPREELSLHLVLDGADLDQKVTAILAQTSQIEPIVRGLGEDYLRDGMAEESFRAAE